MGIFGFYLGGVIEIIFICWFILIFENCLNEFIDKNIYKLDLKNFEN